MQESRRADVQMMAANVWHIYFVWIIKHSEHVAWFADELKLLTDSASMPSSRVKFNLVIYVTDKAESLEVST
jgi:hypothetical protein